MVIKFKIPTTLLIALFTCFCFKAFTLNSNITPTLAPQEAKVIGGFSAPIFFNKYDEKRIEKISTTPNVKLIRISYPLQLKALALKIRNKLTSTMPTVTIDFKEVNLKDTETLKYRHDVVAVVLYFRYPS
jgi:hypothetical protein